MTTSADAILVEDVSADGPGRGGVIRAGSLSDVGFQPLGLLRWMQHGEEVTVQVYVSRYGDAFALPEPREPMLSLRLLSVLQSGRLVQTLALAHGRGGAGGGGDTTIAEPVRGEDPADRILAQVRDLQDRTRLPLRFPDLGGVGIHRQICDVQDPDSLWVAHKGFLRRVQGNDDDVVDHKAMALMVAALRREDHVRQVLERGLRRQAQTLALIVRNVALVIPGLLALSTGLTWWASGLIVGAAAAAALVFQLGLRDRRLRPLLGAVPVVSALIGWFTVGVGTMLGLLVYGLVVLYLSDMVLVDVVQRGLLRLRGDLREPAPVPMPGLVELYG